jgi:hypothetical protein
LKEDQQLFEGLLASQSLIKDPSVRYYKNSSIRTLRSSNSIMGIHKRKEGDVVGLGVIKGLQLSDLKIGDDFGVVGFSNIPEAAQRGRSA